MAAISTALGIASLLASAGGSALAAKRNKQAERDLLAQRSDVDRELYTGALDSVGAKAYLKELDRQAQRNLQAVDNGVISGGQTAENALAQKQRLNETTSEAIDNLLVNKENQKRGYFRDKMVLTGAINENRAQQAQNWMTLAGNIANTAQNLGSEYLDSNEAYIDPDNGPNDRMNLETRSKALSSLDAGGTVKEQNVIGAGDQNKNATLDPKIQRPAKMIAGETPTDAGRKQGVIDVMGENGAIEAVERENREEKRQNLADADQRLKGSVQAPAAQVDTQSPLTGAVPSIYPYQRRR